MYHEINTQISLFQLISQVLSNINTLWRTACLVNIMMK